MGFWVGGFSVCFYFLYVCVCVRSYVYITGYEGFWGFFER